MAQPSRDSTRLNSVMAPGKPPDTELLWGRVSRNLALLRMRLFLKLELPITDADTELLVDHSQAAPSSEILCVDLVGTEGCGLYTLDKTSAGLGSSAPMPTFDVGGVVSSDPVDFLFHQFLQETSMRVDMKARADRPALSAVSQELRKTRQRLLEVESEATHLRGRYDRLQATHRQQLNSFIKEICVVKEQLSRSQRDNAYQSRECDLIAVSMDDADGNPLCTSVGELLNYRTQVLIGQEKKKETERLLQEAHEKLHKGFDMLEKRNKRVADLESGSRCQMETIVTLQRESQRLQERLREGGKKILEITQRLEEQQDLHTTELESAQKAIADHQRQLQEQAERHNRIGRNSMMFKGSGSLSNSTPYFPDDYPDDSSTAGDARASVVSVEGETAASDPASAAGDEGEECDAEQRDDTPEADAGGPAAEDAEPVMPPGERVKLMRAATLPLAGVAGGVQRSGRGANRRHNRNARGAKAGGLGPESPRRGKGLRHHHPQQPAKPQMVSVGLQTSVVEAGVDIPQDMLQKNIIDRWKVKKNPVNAQAAAATAARTLLFKSRTRPAPEGRGDAGDAPVPAAPPAPPAAPADKPVSVAPEPSAEQQPSSSSNGGGGVPACVGQVEPSSSGPAEQEQGGSAAGAAPGCGGGVVAETAAQQEASAYPQPQQGVPEAVGIAADGPAAPQQQQGAVAAASAVAPPQPQQPDSPPPAAPVGAAAAVPQQQQQHPVCPHSGAGQPPPTAEACGASHLARGDAPLLLHVSLPVCRVNNATSPSADSSSAPSVAATPSAAAEPEPDAAADADAGGSVDGCEAEAEPGAECPEVSGGAQDAAAAALPGHSDTPAEQQGQQPPPEATGGEPPPPPPPPPSVSPTVAAVLAGQQQQQQQPPTRTAVLRDARILARSLRGVSPASSAAALPGSPEASTTPGAAAAAASVNPAGCPVSGAAVDGAADGGGAVDSEAVAEGGGGGGVCPAGDGDAAEGCAAAVVVSAAPAEGVGVEAVAADLLLWQQRAQQYAAELDRTNEELEQIIEYEEGVEKALLEKEKEVEEMRGWMGKAEILTHNLEQARNVIRDMSADGSELEARVQDLEDQNYGLIHHNVETAGRFADKLAESLTQVKTLFRKNEALESSFVHMKRKVRSLKQREGLDEYKQRIVTRERTRADREIVKQTAALRTERDLMRGEFDALKDEARRLREHLRMRCEELRSDRRSLATALGEREDELAALRKQYSGLLDGYSLLRDECRVLLRRHDSGDATPSDAFRALAGKPLSTESAEPAKARPEPVATEEGSLVAKQEEPLMVPLPPLDLPTPCLPPSVSAASDNAQMVYGTFLIHKQVNAFFHFMAGKLSEVGQLGSLVRGMSYEEVGEAVHSPGPAAPTDIIGLGKSLHDMRKAEAQRDRMLKQWCLVSLEKMSAFTSIETRLQSLQYYIKHVTTSVQTGSMHHSDFLAKDLPASFAMLPTTHVDTRSPEMKRVSVCDITCPLPEQKQKRRSVQLPAQATNVSVPPALSIADLQQQMILLRRNLERGVSTPQPQAQLQPQQLRVAALERPSSTSSAVRSIGSAHTPGTGTRGVPTPGALPPIVPPLPTGSTTFRAGRYEVIDTTDDIDSSAAPHIPADDLHHTTLAPSVVATSEASSREHDPQPLSPDADTTPPFSHLKRPHACPRGNKGWTPAQRLSLDSDETSEFGCMELGPQDQAAYCNTRVEAKKPQLRRAGPTRYVKHGSGPAMAVGGQRVGTPFDGKAVRAARRIS